MSQPIKYYQVVRYYLEGLKPIVIQSQLSMDEALALARVNNGNQGPENSPRTWFDIVQAEGLF